MSSSTSARFSPGEAIDRRSNQRQQLVQSVVEINATLPQLPEVKSCAILGCGSGHLDLEFISSYLPNVQKLTAVEPNADQLAAFKSKVAQVLPNVSIDVCQETAQSWKGGDQPYHAVFLFHTLYYVPQYQRPALFKKLFDQVVADGGFVFVVASPSDNDRPTMFCRLIHILSLPLYNVMEDTDGLHVRDMMTSAGFRNCYQLIVEYRVDAAEPNDDLMSVFVYLSGGMLGLESVRDEVQTLLAGDRWLRDEMWFGVFQKP